MQIDELRSYAYTHQIPLDVNIELNQYCNFKCPHCYCAEKKTSLSTDQIKKIISKCYDAGVLFINFTGGEVLIRKDFAKIYEYAKSLGFLISIQSNLYHLSDEVKSIFLKKKPKNISITLYGASEEEYFSYTGKKNGYENVIKNIDFLYTNNIDFRLKAILAKSTYSSIMKKRYDEIALKYGKRIKYDGIIFGKKDGHLSSIRERLDPNEIVAFDRCDHDGRNFWDDITCQTYSQEEVKCGGGIASFSIDSTGYASICSLYVSEKFDFINQEFSTLWKKLNLSHEHMQMNYKLSKCSSCDKKSICRWCSAYSFLECGDSTKPIQFMCDLASARVAANGKC